MRLALFGVLVKINFIVPSNRIHSFTDLVCSFMCKVTVLSPQIIAENKRVWTSVLMMLYTLVHGLENYNG